MNKRGVQRYVIALKECDVIATRGLLKETHRCMRARTFKVFWTFLVYKDPTAHRLLGVIGLEDVVQERVFSSFDLAEGRLGCDVVRDRHDD